MCNDPDLCWLTDLSIDCRFIDEGALYQIPLLRNLRTLKVREGDSCRVTDRVMRCWADAAKDEGSFGNLESVVLDRYSLSDRDFTSMSLFRLSDFPVLQAYTVLNAPREVVQKFAPKQPCGGFVRQRQLPTRAAVNLPQIPRLTVCVGTLRTRNADEGLAFTLHLERGTSSYKMDSGVSVEEVHGSQVDGAKRVTKKRKLRKGKAINLDDMLLEHS